MEAGGPAGGAELPFKNDGSFMEQFLKMQQQKEEQQSKEASVSEQDGSAAPSRGTSVGPDEPNLQETNPSSSRAPSEAPDADGDDFIQARSFAGARPGYVFKMDSLGLGFYKDCPLEERIQVAKDTAKEVARKAPVVLKANNPLLKSLGKRGVEIPAVVGGVKKTKATDDSQKPKYLQEMDKYKSRNCGGDAGGGRPLVK